jgi:membrane protein DedA with SNARE-associated domain
MAEWIIRFIEQHGYLAVAGLMVVENLFPPIPSELIMPFAGFAAARGELNAVAVVAVGAVSSVVGALPWYVVGRWIGRDRLLRWVERDGRWLTVERDDLLRAESWFARRGALAVCVGRLVPALRSVISAPAGIARMPLLRFLLWSTLGSAIWCAALVTLGHLLEQRYTEVARWLDPATRIILAGCVLAYAWRWWRYPRRRAQRPSTPK